MFWIAFGVVLPWLLVLVGGWLVWHLIAQNGRIVLRLEAIEQRLMPPPPHEDAVVELPLGFAAPHFELTDLSGNRQELRSFLGRRILLVFFEPECDFCLELAPYLAEIPIDGTDERPLPVIVARGTADQNRALAAEMSWRFPILLQEQTDISSRYHATATPTAYLIDERGLIGSRKAMGREQIMALSANPDSFEIVTNGQGETPASSARDGSPPPAVERAWNLARAITDFAADGFKTLSEIDYRQRLETCDPCDRRRGNQCLECGCYLRLKARGRAFDCPLGKWPKFGTETRTPT